MQTCAAPKPRAVSQYLFDVPLRVVVSENGGFPVTRRAGGVQVVGGGKNRVGDAVDVLAPVAVGIDAVGGPGREEELAGAGGAGRIGSRAHAGQRRAAEVRLHFVDRRDNREALRAEFVLSRRFLKPRHIVGRDPSSESAATTHCCISPLAGLEVRAAESPAKQNRQNSAAAAAARSFKPKPRPMKRAATPKTRRLRRRASVAQPAVHSPAPLASQAPRRASKRKENCSARPPRRAAPLISARGGMTETARSPAAPGPRPAGCAAAGGAGRRAALQRSPGSRWSAALAAPPLPSSPTS